QPAREDIDQASQLAQADDLARGQVRDMGAAEERQQVVLAKAVERNVAQDHEVVARVLEKRVLDDPARVDAVTLGEEGQRFGDAARRLGEALPARVLADGDEQLARGVLEIVERGAFGRPRQAHDAITSAELFSDSTRRSLTRRAGAKTDERRSKATWAMFSAVGITSRRKSTSLFRCLWSTLSMSSRRSRLSTRLRLITIPVSGSTGPLTVTSTT